MWVGDVLENRFLIERPLGSGGMGSVYLATDRAEGRPVAVKVLDLDSHGAVERFRREARVLSELAHPGIVRYVTHGETEARESFLVMELLEGEDLAHRLARGGLSVEDSLALVRRAAEALGFAHAAGIVHRDVKPSNLFLVGGDVGRVKVLDFGIARTSLQTQGLTQTGAMLGTVGYMAPEQATGSRDVDARADVFALGCVLFECLTGRPAFVGDHAVAVLAKVLTEEAPRVSELRSGLGETVDVLVARMLAKDAADRPEDASAVLREMDGLALLAGSVRQQAAGAPEGLTASERKMVSVILAEPARAGTAGTVTPENAHQELARVQELAAKFGAEATPLAGGALLVVLSGGGAATDQAARAASCALGLRQLQPDLRLVLATGWGETAGPVPVGPVIDRAATLLRSPESDAIFGIGIDDVTAGLLGPRFDVRGGVLIGDADDFERPPLLMGKPTPTVGREKEIALLEATLTECIDDNVARVMLVTAPAGAGKSRLATEWVGRERRTARARVLAVRFETVGGSRLVPGLVRKAALLTAGDALAAQQARLFAYMAALLPGAEGRQTAEFLGEAVGVPTPDVPSPPLIAARNDPRIMADRVPQALVAWLGAECARQPLVLVLEDLHWADLGSVAQLEAILERLADRPLLVIALARPEARESFRALWARQGAHEVKLDALTRRAGERLVYAALGEATQPEIVSRIVNRAGGNAFYLEELIRSAAEGRDDLPESVVAMAVGRLERLEPEARRVLRAASVFGEAFSTGGAEALLGKDSIVDPWIEALTGREVLECTRESRVAGEREYRFRHALLRDAAYGTLTESDRRAGHGFAAEWLAQQEQSDPLAIAKHFEEAGNQERAASWLMRAVSQAWARGSTAANVEELVNRALAAGLTGRERGLARAFQAMLSVFRSDTHTTIEAGREAIRLLPVSQPEWFWAAGVLLGAATAAGTGDPGVEIVTTVLSLDAMPPATGPLGFGMFCLAWGALSFGQSALATRVLERCEEAAAAATANGGARDPYFLGYQAITRAGVETCARDSLGAALVAAREAEAQFALAGALVNMSHGPFWVGIVLSEAGSLDAALVKYEKALRGYRELGNEHMVQQSLGARGRALTLAGRREGPELLLPLVTSTDGMLRDGARVTLVIAYLLAQDPDSAERYLPPVSEIEASSLRMSHRPLFALHALVLLSQGAVQEALALAERAASDQGSTSMMPLSRSIVLLAHAECLHAAGRNPEAGEAIRIASDRLRRVADGFDDATMREGYLTNIGPNARTLALAKEWLGE